MIKLVIRYSFLLLLTICGYQILYANFLVARYPMSITFVMFLLPIFAYLLQQSIQKKTPDQVKWYLMILYSMLMIWLMALILSTVRYLAFAWEFEWFFSPQGFAYGPTPLWLIIKRNLFGYTLFGIPSAFLAQLALFLRQKVGSKKS